MFLLLKSGLYSSRSIVGCKACNYGLFSFLNINHTQDASMRWRCRQSTFTVNLALRRAVTNGHVQEYLIKACADHNLLSFSQNDDTFSDGLQLPDILSYLLQLLELLFITVLPVTDVIMCTSAWFFFFYHCKKEIS